VRPGWRRLANSIIEVHAPNVAEEDRQRHIALVGILATAAVGISGTAASFFIARDDRANQRAVEHEARVMTNAPRSTSTRSS
jgi:hypothetical protein